MFYRTLYYHLKLILRTPGEWLNPLLFFVMVVSLFPIAIGTDKNLLVAIAPGVIWVAALLASLLSLPQLFRSDYLDGSLEQLLLQPTALSLLVAAKIAAHWFTHQLPLIIIAPLSALFFQLPAHSCWVLLLTLLLGTPILSLFGGIMAALTVSLRGNANILLPLLLLPLLVPVLIFATGAVFASEQHLPVSGELAILAAFAVLAIGIAPWVIAFALRIGVET